MKHDVNVNSIYVVVESNDLDTNVTLTPCLSYKGAQDVFHSIRDEYLEDAGGDSDYCVEEDDANLFAVRMTSEGDFIACVQIQKLWK